MERQQRVTGLSPEFRVVLEVRGGGCGGAGGGVSGEGDCEESIVWGGARGRCRFLARWRERSGTSWRGCW